MTQTNRVLTELVDWYTVFRTFWGIQYISKSEIHLALTGSSHSKIVNSLWLPPLPLWRIRKYVTKQRHFICPTERRELRTVTMIFISKKGTYFCSYGTWDDFFIVLWCLKETEPTCTLFILQILTLHSNDYSLPSWQHSFSGFALEWPHLNRDFWWPKSAYRCNSPNLSFLNIRFQLCQQLVYLFENICSGLTDV